ncbi:ABC transporter substrate-binding protein [Prevotella sp. E13-17]|uniref:ABC transporter substrate-binding protein n=1 Tax=Prevotella sp. E13-17 TaxID=2913616 RepID=UPI001EDC3885|nr:ABC transporter substrate-binding protein [Prevotella sp. E13-17]UKK51679.1 ABC transporter substrate-binding protein [Prevotella sp. E13-17]
MKHSAKHILLSSLACLLVMFCACSGGHRRSAESAAISDSLSNPTYAKGFTVRVMNHGVRLVDVADPQEDEDRMPVDYHFALVPKGTQDVAIPQGYVRVDVPIERTIVMTMLQLSNFIALDGLDVVKGITGTKNLFNKDVRRRVKEGQIVKIGMEGNFDTELILAAHPEVIFISPFKRGGYEAIKETGITLIPHLGYKELHPLGQAEWIKFVAMFTGQEQQADSLFDHIAQNYHRVKVNPNSLADDAIPTVFSGEMHGGNWYAVGGKNSLAQLFRDAGADYVIHDDNTGGVNIEFEQMYATAANADYWRILNSYEGDFSYEALLQAEPRNKLFKAFRDKHVVYCNMKQTPYYEMAPVRPDLVLLDLVHIFHPGLLSDDHQPVFYHLLK